ncbi:MAG: efflux RND transporter periplasmic adaptor subunit [Elusimicrobia bacterium]|nr:efflux RND transporter periplasmic adaptor subunit [Elusimicrobiota bacterium]
MKRAIIAVVVAAAVGGGVWKFKSASRKESRADRAKPVEAVIGPIEQSIDATGSVAPENRVEIKPPVGGRVEKLLVDEGDKVKNGQVVALISSTDRNAILDAARAQGPEAVKKWEDAYKPTAVFASLPGDVILRNVVVGQAVDGGTVLFAVADTLIVNAQVDESDIGKIKLGQKVRIRLDSYPEQPVDGKVFDMLYEGKNVSNVITYGVKVRPDKVPPFFRSQMTANVSFLVKRKEDALLLPAAAIKDAPGGKRVVQLPGAEPGAAPETREVKTGIETDEQVEIVSGLSAGDKVLVAAGKYKAQTAPESSPLSFMGRGMGRGGAQRGAAPKPRKTATGSASPGTGSAPAAAGGPR